ncbi:MAG: hypothetical protein AAFY71_14825 [Bacteroidota bacterium]
MEKDAYPSLAFYLRLSVQDEQDLASLREWDHLHMALAGGFIWLTGFSEKEIHSSKVQRIPHKELFYGKEGKLFFLDKLLPQAKEPQLDWKPIQQVLRIRLSGYNHNFFGLEEHIQIRLIPSEKIRSPFGLIVDLDAFSSYMQSAPVVRTQHLKWLQLQEHEVLVIGSPTLPLEGMAIWKSGNHLLPTGYEFDLQILSSEIANRIDPSNTHWILWKEDPSFLMFKKEWLKTLSISSVRQTIK